MADKRGLRAEDPEWQVERSICKIAFGFEKGHFGMKSVRRDMKIIKRWPPVAHRDGYQNIQGGGCDAGQHRRTWRRLGCVKGAIRRRIVCAVKEERKTRSKGKNNSEDPKAPKCEDYRPWEASWMGYTGSM